jgi:hypothetical protein
MRGEAMKSARPTTLPIALQRAQDTREVFSFFFKKAALWPDGLMAPQRGRVRRVVLMTEDFNDRFVSLLEMIPELSRKVEGLEELRFWGTAITQAGEERLRSLLPGVKVTKVSDEQFATTNGCLCPRFNLEVGSFDIPEEENPDAEDIEQVMLKRFGGLPLMFRPPSETKPSSGPEPGPAAQAPESKS